MSFFKDASSKLGSGDSDDESDVASGVESDNEGEVPAVAPGDPDVRSDLPSGLPINKAALSLLISNAINSVAENAGPKKQTVTKTINLSYTGSINDLSNDKNPVLKSNWNQIGSVLGKDVAVSKITLVKYKNTFPISLGINAEHFKGIKVVDHVTDTGPVMAELVDKSQEKFEPPAVVFQSQNATFKREFEKKFPGVSADNIGSELQTLKSNPLYKDHVLVAADSAEMHAISVELAKQKADAVAQNKQLAVVEPVASEAGVIVHKPLAITAINVLKKTMEMCDDRIPLNQFYFTIQRTRVSESSVDAQRSQQTNIWVDPLELRSSIKSGQQFATELEKKFYVALTIEVELASESFN
jgi:hypothetical protein